MPLLRGRRVRVVHLWVGALMVLSMVLATAGTAAAESVLLTGTVRALEAQAIYTPPSDSSPVVLRYYVPEGTEVQPGDPLVRIDPGQSLTQIRSLEAQIEQAEARAAKEIAELQVAAVDAEIALTDASATLQKARIDAAVPREHLSGLDYDRYQGELERASREHALKQRELDAANAAVARRRNDATLEVQKLDADRRYHEARASNAEVRAERAGVVVHGFDNRRGGRFDEGSTSWPGNQIGEVVAGGAYGVRAFVLEADRGWLSEGQPVTLAFDALPGATVQATVSRIAGAPDAKAEWGQGRWYELDISLPDSASQLPLKPGMSVRVEVATTNATSPAIASAQAAASPVTLDGEIHATTTAPILPPSVDTLWQFTITSLTPDGAPVTKGDVVVAFDGGQVTQELMQKQSTLKEKQTQHANLLLDLAERARQEQLATEERVAAVDKSARKATQPADLIGRNDYAKLVIEREQAEAQLALAERREALSAEQRRQERRLLEAEIGQLEAEVADLQRSLVVLEVRAPRDGVMVHRSGFGGDKFDVGSQVWRGLAVAEIPDMATLAVQATLAERDLSRIRAGQPARISIEGGAGAALRGRVASIGRTVRSKSRVQPVPVVDVLVEFDSPPSRLKPGQPVRVELLQPAAAGSTAP